MSDSEEENFCFYGKALEPYDEDAVPKKKPISVEEQIATDAQGRRRFHGAFTGGFSAGFYNTVGSLEGWKPSEFKSSRSDKAQSKQAKPEDFMDDEDIAEHGIAPQTVKATNDYASNRKRKKQVFGEGPIPGEPVLHTLITSGNETIGYLLMKNMDLKQQPPELDKSDVEGPKIYGCVMPKTYEIKRNIEYEDAIPNIYAYHIKNIKSNTFGLGYIGLDKSHLNLFKSTQLVVKDKDNKKLSISGQAFGVGAFENEDEDIYAKDDMSQYDFTLTSEKKSVTPSLKTDTIFDNFVLSKIPLLPGQKFELPIIPHSFTGKHKVKKSRFEPIVENKIERKDMNAVIRARYIGEHVDEPQPSSSNQTNKNVLPPIQAKSIDHLKEEIDNNSKKNFTSNSFLDKFVSSSQIENPHDILEEVKRAEIEHGTQEMRDAAKLKMYGPLTRIITDWQPCSLLCKRFNVREPLLEDKIKRNDRKKNHIIFEYQKNNEDNLKLEAGLRITKEESDTASKNEAITTASKNEAITMDISTMEQSITATIQEIPIAEPCNRQEDNKVSSDMTEKINVAKNIDLFKAVFLSSSESESESEEKTEEEEKKREDLMKENVLNELLIPKIKSNKEGILSHIKFNPLFQQKDSKLTDKDDVAHKKDAGGECNKDTDPIAAKEIEIEKDPNIYGPALPAKIQASVNSYLPNIVIDDEWIEKESAEKKKSHKHKKKHKKEKHKKEHKSKSKR